MTHFMNMWKKPEDKPPQRTTEMASQLLIHTNEIFKVFLNKCSWFVYFIAGFLIMCCIFYYIYDYRRRMELGRRRQDEQRTTERIPQRRRPGGVGNKEMPGRKHCESYVLKRTRSGAIYGRFADSENIAS